MSNRILILSHDDVFSRMLELEFSALGLSVVVAQEAGEEAADVILLDLDTALPPDAARDARMIGFTRSFSMGAVDTERRCSLILHRPFEMRLLREEVLSCFANEHPSPVPFETGRRIRLRVEEESRSLCFGDTQISMSPKEWCVMECLLAHRGETVTREELAARIGESSANKVEVYVCLLRQKLATVTDRTVIRTVRGKGYRISQL